MICTLYNGKDGWNSWKTQCYMSFEHSLSVILEFLYALSDITQGPKKRQFSKIWNFVKGNFPFIWLFCLILILFSIYLWDSCFFGACSNASGYHLLTKKDFLKLIIKIIYRKYQLITKYSSVSCSHFWFAVTLIKTSNKCITLNKSDLLTCIIL